MPAVRPGKDRNADHNKKHNQQPAQETAPIIFTEFRLRPRNQIQCYQIQYNQNPHTLNLRLDTLERELDSATESAP
jgi:hypothetical protein